MIKNRPSLQNSKIANDYVKDSSIKGYSKLLSLELDSTWYVFTRLETKSGNRNFVFRFTSTDYGEMELIQNNSAPIINSGLFKREGTINPPDIIFYDLTTKEKRKSIMPPYRQFDLFK